MAYKVAGTRVSMRGIMDIPRPRDKLTSTQSIDGEKVGVHDVGGARALKGVDDRMSGP